MDKTKFLSHLPWSVIIVISLALAIRLLGITWGLPGPGRYLPWTADETTFVSSLYRMDPLHLDLNPGYFKTPSFTVYLLGASLALWAVLGWVDIVPDKSYYVQHLEQRGRIFLAGRLNSAIFATLSVVLIYLLVRRLYPRRPRWVALLAAALLSVLPAHVAWSHYLSQNPLVVFWILFTFLALLRLMEAHQKRWYIVAGFGSGIALSTNYNAAPLLLLLVAAHFLTAEGTLCKGADSSLMSWPRTSLLSWSLVFVIMGFITFTPYSVLDARFFWSEFMWEFHAVGNMQRVNLGTMLYHVFGEVLPDGLGWCLYLLGITGLVWMAVSKKLRGGEILLLVWNVVYLLLTLRAGLFASAGRTLPLLVFFPVLSADLIFKLYMKSRRIGGKYLVITLSILLITTTSLMAVLVDVYLLTDTVRSDASTWITEHIPPASSIGLLREPWWFSPDVIATDYLHPEVTGGIYRYIRYDYNAKRLELHPTTYIVAASQEFTKRYREAQDPTKREFMTLLNQQYQPVESFHTHLGLGLFWPRKHILGSGLWAPPDIVILQRLDSGSE